MPASQEPAAPEAAPRWRFGNHVFDESTLELRVAGDKRELMRKPAELLMFFLRNPGEVVTKDELLEAVWPGRIVSETSLTNAIARLRTTLGDDAQELVKSVYGYGYRFLGEPIRDSAEPARTVLPEALGFKDGDPMPLREGWFLRRRLGAGGGGEVWLAQLAATKEMRVFKFARDRSALSALKREITLSRLIRESLGERDDFVHVLDWNLETEPFFIGLEHCSEGSLADWAERQGGIRVVPMAQRLELLAQAAEALAAAHSVGVLHKDLKPSNLLLHRDSAGQLLLRLADFGSARLIDRDRLMSADITRMGFTQTLVDNSTGTPLYLAPELLTGSPPTTRSDVYALGVMLYQLAVGDLRRSLAPGWERSVEDPLLIEDIAEAAAGDTQARLADPLQLAQRLRSLDTRRVAREQNQAEAHAAEVTRRALERAKARRSLLIGLAATLVIGLVATATLYLRANHARVEAQASAALAQSEAARANAVAAFLTDDLLSAGNPEIAGRRDVTVREVLDAAQSRLEGRFKDQPRVEATLTRILGTAYAGLNEREPSERLLRSAEQSLAALLGPADTETQAARMRLRDVYLYWFDTAAAGATLDRASAAENAAGRPHPEIAVEAENQRDLLDCWAGFVSIYLARCVDVADGGYRRALKQFGPDNRVTLSAAMDAGDARLKIGLASEAASFFQMAHKGYSQHFPGDLYWLTLSELLLNESLIASGQAKEALPSISQLIQRYRAVYGANARIEMTARRWWALALLDLNDTDAALTELGELRGVWLKQEKGLPHDYAWIEYARAEALLRRQRPAEAESALKDAMQRIAPEEQPSGYWTLMLRERLADIRIAQKDRGAAERLLRQNRNEARSLLTKGEWLLGWSLYRLGDHLAADGRKDEALPLLKEAVPVLEASLGADEKRTRQARERLAAVAG